MIIDSHQHFWNYDSARDTWIDDSMKILRRDFLPSDLEPILKKNDVNGCIVIQADQSEVETQYLLEAANKNSFIKGVVGWVDLCAGNIENRLEFYAQNNAFKGVRHIVQSEPDVNFVLRPDFQNGISKLSKFGLTYDILIYPHQLTSIVKLVSKYPNQKFILDHLAKPSISEGLSQEWVLGIEALAKYPNVSCKLSGMVTETRDYCWNMEDFIPFLDVTVKAFGINRLMFGSDWPVCKLGGTYQEVINILKNYFKPFSEAEKEHVFAKNAISVYNI